MIHSFIYFFSDPETQDRVNGDLDRLEELLKELLDLGTRNVEAKTNHDEPTALATAKEMNKKYDEIDDVLDDLTSALKPGVGQKHPDGPQSVEKDVPAHLRQLFAAAKELEKKLPPVVGSAEDAKGNPGEEEKKAFAKALEDLEVPMRGVKAHDSDEDKAVALAKILEDHVDDMVGAAKEGKQDGVVSGARFYFIYFFFFPFLFRYIISIFPFLPALSNKQTSFRYQIQTRPSPRRARLPRKRPQKTRKAS